MPESSADLILPVESVAISDIGLRRANNQDSHAQVIATKGEQWERSGHLFLVADGMGAHAAGELASKMAAETIAHLYYKYDDQSSQEALVHAIEDANIRIHSQGEANPGFHGMGTTCTVLLLLPQGAIVGHVGDSRAYRLRGNSFEQLTFDHSLVWEMSASGKISEADVPQHIPRNIITRSLGPNSKVQVDVEGPFPLQPGDSFLLCSDGLSGQLDDKELATLLKLFPPSQAAAMMVDIAKLRGGPDNITVIIAQVLGGSSALDSPVQASPVRRQPHESRMPLGWVIAAVFILLATVLLATGHSIAASIPFLFGVASILFEVIRASMVGNGNDDTSHYTPRAGRAPYRHCKAKADKTFAESVHALAVQLRSATSEMTKQVDWSGFDKLCQAAQVSLSQGKWDLATRDYCLAIRGAMQEMNGGQGS